MSIKRGFFILFLLILVSTTLALEVRLSEPENATTITVNTIIFKCKSIQVAQETLKNLTLYIFPQNAPTWHSSTKQASDDQLTEFQANIPLNGLYHWNCLAKNSNNEQFFAPQNKTFLLDVNTNTRPTILTIPDQTKDSLNSFSLDFTQYESDQEDQGPDLDWSVSDFDTSIINIEVTDLDGDTITFSPLTYGTTTVNLTLTDSGNLKDSQIITITLEEQDNSSQTSNNPPTIKTTIPDQNMTGFDSWKLDLTEYEEDQEDSSSNLKWSVSGVDTSLCGIELTDEDDDEITFTPQKTGSDTITLTLTDSDGASTSQSLKVIINEESSTITEDNEEFDDLEPDTKLVNSYTPTETEISITTDQLLTFSISTFETTTIKWTLNGDYQDTNNIFFLNTNNLENNKEHILIANIKRSSTEEEITWTLTKNLETATIPLEEETEELTEENLITGFSVANIGTKIKDTLKSKTVIIILIVLAVIILFLIILYFLRKKGFKFKKPTIYKDIQIPKEQKTLDELIKQKKVKPIKKDFNINDIIKKPIKKTFSQTPDLSEIKSFIRKRQSWGETEEMIKQKLSKNYTQEQIDKAFEELKKKPLFKI